MIAPSDHRTPNSRQPWFAHLPYPIDAISYEFCEDVEIALELLEIARDTLQTIRQLKDDGWQLRYHWTEDDDAFFSLDHNECLTANDASKRLAALGITKIRCLDLGTPFSTR